MPLADSPAALSGYMKTPASPPAATVADVIAILCILSSSTSQQDLDWPRFPFSVCIFVYFYKGSVLRHDEGIIGRRQAGHMLTPKETLRCITLVLVATAQCFILQPPHLGLCPSSTGHSLCVARVCEFSTSRRHIAHSSRMARHHSLFMCNSEGGEGRGGVLRSASQTTSIIRSCSSSTERVPPPPPVALDQLPASVAYLFDDETSTHMYIVGTSHISQLSARDVTEVGVAVTPPFPVQYPRHARCAHFSLSLDTHGSGTRTCRN